jgi:peroxiredoxin
MWSLGEGLAAGMVVLVFFRGHWCPYCRRYLAKLAGSYSKIVEAGAEVVAISPDPVFASAGLVKELGLPFRVLSDPEGRVVEMFGVRNGFSSVAGKLPHPSVLIITRDGVIRFRSVDRNYKKRTTMRAILGGVIGAAGASVGPGGR